ncbi:MAG: ABC transporter ATP-binding protein [Proteobacteria bacterium]|nr:ABC transporter ATP-binding protein [Pseudomonadota bacterium]
MSVNNVNQLQKKQKSGIAVLLSILRLNKGHWGTLLLIQLCCLAWALEANILPYALRFVLDALQNHDAIPEGSLHPVVIPIVLGMSAWVVIISLFHFGDYVMANFIAKFKENMRMAAYEHVSQQSYGYFVSNMSGSIASQISDLARSSWDVMELLIQTFIPAFLGVIVAIGLFAVLHPMFGMILICWVTMHLLCCFYFSQKCRSLAQVHAMVQNGLSGRIADSLANHSIIRLFTAFSGEYRYIKNAQNLERQQYTISLMYVAKMKLVLGVVYLFWVGGVMTLAEIYAYKYGIMSIGELVYVINTANNIGMMMWVVAIMMPNLFQELGVSAQGLSLLDVPITIEDAENAGILKVLHGSIEFRNVVFHYHEGQTLFEEQNAFIPAGQKVGLVGFSGSGKTTFTNLILRYFDVISGEILIDGQNIKKVTQESLRRNIAMIPQDAALFNRSIMENIKYSNAEATEEEVIWAAKMANCHQFIKAMPEGYATIVGERGSKLSGGQRQRIAIARAFLKESKILILDEATSALDSNTERLIQESLSKIMSHKTTLVIAHRLSTLVQMDRILVFYNGKIVEDGSHDELIEHDGHYAKLWSMQMGGFLADGDNSDFKE